MYSPKIKIENMDWCLTDGIVHPEQCWSILECHFHSTHHDGDSEDVHDSHTMLCRPIVGDTVADDACIPASAAVAIGFPGNTPSFSVEKTQHSRQCLRQSHFHAHRQCYLPMMERSPSGDSVRMTSPSEWAMVANNLY